MQKDKKNKIIEAKNIAKKYSGNEPIHGFPHVKRVHDHFVFLEKYIKNKSRKILEALEWAVFLHDIGNCCGRKQHGANSVTILKINYENLDIPQKKLVEYAITYHSDPEKKHPPDHPRNTKDFCLAFLMMLDHMDAFGTTGVCRAKKYLEKEGSFKWIPKGNEFKFIKKHINNFFSRDIRICKENKNNSLLEHLLFNYYYIDENYNRIKNEVKSEFYKKYNKLKKEQEKYIRELINKGKITNIKYPKIFI